MRCLIPWCAILLLPAWAAFVPPEEGLVPFRRDRVPLDVDTQASLARGVIDLASRAGADTPEARRHLAQLAALALALDPEFPRPRELVAEVSEGKWTPADDGGLPPVGLWRALVWLETPEAGADGNALAACLGDVLAVADPRHPKAQARGGELGGWKDWVAEADAFETREPAAIPELLPPELVPEPSVPEKSLELSELNLVMPLWVKTGRGVFLEPVPVLFRGEIDGSNEEARFVVAGKGLSERFAGPMKVVEAGIRARHDILPRGLTVSLGFGEAEYLPSENGEVLAGTAALLLEGALTGVVPHAIALAQVGEGGRLELPPDFWRTLRALAGLPGGERLILPDRAAEFLPALLTLDHAGFFMRHEVLLAGSVQELCDLAAELPSGAAGEAIRRFGEIRKTGEGKPVGSFVAHPSTRQGLREVAEMMPKHASARMLALQGAGNRPRHFRRPVLAREVLAALEPASIIGKGTAVEVEAEDLESMRVALRAALDKLGSYTDSRDRDLLQPAAEFADRLRTLARLTAKLDEGDEEAFSKQPVEAAAAARRYRDVIRDLTAEAGKPSSGR